MINLNKTKQYLSKQEIFNYVDDWKISNFYI